ncbi:LysR substrate-binding domain-containing protein [Flavisphingomonas formosensis]|uniref:LysR substrate-binding domain-containing protein n=1 Tax=Flavisphingomonas formosensis TaxID=861534 RepID=UPI0012F7A7BF|nr:LysR substrate-binding domain-containing protein [Sphingomonas formosensis]
MPRPINLRQIEAFKALIESGTVSGAADLVGLSQPAVSKLIANLEFDAGVSLFDRVKGRLAPTANAMRLYDEVGRIFAGVRQVQNALDAIRREEQGRLAVGVMPALSGSFIQRATSRFLDVSPEVFCSVQTLSSQWIIDLLIARKIDVGLVDGGIENPYVTHDPLMTHPLVCVMPHDHPLRKKSKIKAQDLDGVPFVALHRDTNLGLRVENILEEHGVRPNIGIISNATQTIAEFVAAGRGVSLLHPLMISGLEDRIVARRFSPEVLYNFQLCRSADSRNTRLVDAFVQELRRMTDEISSSML